MLRYISAALLLAALAWMCTPQNKPMSKTDPVPTERTDYADYAALWQRVDSLRDQRLPASMLTVVNEIYTKADRENNEPQLVKSLVYRAKLESQTTEAATEDYFEKLRSAIATADNIPAHVLLESILAEAYESYALNQAWQIRQRTPLSSPRAGRAVDTWTLEDLEAESNALFLRSARYPETQRIDIRDYRALLTEAANTVDLRPTLYDLLAQRAIEHLLRSNTQLTEAAYAFRIDDPAAFGPLDTFLVWQPTTGDTTSAKLRAMQLMQDWLRFRRGQNNTAALLDADLYRLQLVDEAYTGADGEELYAAALRRIEESYATDPAAANAAYLRARLLVRQGRSWQPIAGEVNDSLRLKNRRAVELCRQTVARHGGSYGAQRCAQLIFDLQRPSLSLQVEQVNLPGQALPALVAYQNTTDVHLRVMRMNDTRMRAYRLAERRRQDGAGIAYLRGLPAVQTQHYALPDKADYREHRVEVKLDALPPGSYAVLAAEDDAFDPESAQVGHVFFQVSGLGAWHRTRTDGRAELVVYDRAGGQPIAGAAVDVFKSQYNSRSRKQERQLDRTLTTDADGRATLTADGEFRQYQYSVRHRNDTLDTDQGFYLSNDRSVSRSQRTTELYLDRAIYRPGQTVYFKAIALERDPEGRPRLLTNEAITVALLDVNRQKTSELSLTTNEYGSVQGSFTAPGGLTGTMTLETGHGRKTFRVEEYKRPKFEAAFEPVAESYRLNEEVTVTGSAQAYAGAAVDGATVRYRVTREVRYPYWWYRGPRPNGGAQQLAAGETATDAQGKFTVKFTAKPVAGADLDKNPVYYYRVEADVVDISGEVRSATTQVRVGAVALEVSTDLPDLLPVDSLSSFVIQTKNLNGQSVDRGGQLLIRELEPPKRTFKERYWEAPDLYVLTQAQYAEFFPHLAYLDENETRAWPAVRTRVEQDWQSGEVRLPQRLDAGTYLLTITTEDRYGAEVNYRKVIQLYNPKTKQLPAPVIGWTNVAQTRLQPGDELRLDVATSLDKLPVLVELARGEEILHSEWLTAAQWADYRYRVTEADRGGLSLRTTYAKLGRFYTESYNVRVPWDNKALTIDYESFRDKLEPGAKERWTLKVSGPQRDAAAAELLVTLYDASLDAFAANSFRADWWPTRHMSYELRWMAPAYGSQRLNTYRFNYPDAPTVMDWQYHELLAELTALPYANVYRRGPQAVSSEMLMMAAPASARSKELAEESMEADVQTTAAESAEPPRTAEPPAPEPPAAPPVRENLDETVFFFPQLRTDAEGRVLIDFTMNEALTEWKFLGLAHTQDLKVGTTEQTVVTQKELMVLPNVPRFVREGDEVVFASKVTNVTEEALNGQVVLSLKNPLTDRPVFPQAAVSQFTKPFEVSAKASTVVEWRFRVPNVTELPLLEHTIVATAGKYSDGERAVLPVLTNRMLLTETKPLPVSGKSTRTFTFNSLVDNDSKTLSHEGLTLELTSNPAWYAVQALPYLMEYPYECTEQIFSRYYANTLASSIANQHPRVKQIYQQWKRAGSDALVSNLSKNEELKTALLSETPWVLAAQSETEQKQRIGLLFDLNRMANEQRTALTKIRQRQQAGGGWPWMPGGPDNWYISQYLVEGLAHLREMGATEAWSDSELDMLRKAVAYLDREAALAYAELERRVKRGNTTFDEDHLSPILLHYLYTRSYFLRENKDQATIGNHTASAAAAYFPLDKQGQKVLDYYTGQAEQYWAKRNLMSQAMATLALHRLERTTNIAQQLQSFRERALHNEELGMYYRPEPGYYWYQLPVRTHVKMIEVFDAVAKDAEAVNDLKVWLLKNKQTNHWKTTKATADAVYAFLSTGADWLAETQPVRVTWKDKAVQQQTTSAQADAEAGTGYFKTRIPAERVSKQLGTVTLDNPNAGPAWGALYWQYFEDIDQVKSFEETPLTLKRQLFKVRTGDRGEVLEPLADGAALQVGDKVRARVELRVDRAMEYVHLKDARAAGFEPVNVLSSYKYQDGLGYYESTTDAATNFFMGYLAPGNYVFEYTLNATLAGDYSHGVTSIQCMYAPEYSSHSEGMRVVIE